MENKKDLKIEKFLQTIANNNNLNKSNNYNVWNRLNQNLDIYENKIPEFNSYNSFNEKKKKEIGSAIGNTSFTAYASPVALV